MTEVWVLDVVGYDTRGGMADVYSTLENAKASKPGVTWVEDGKGGWYEKQRAGSLSDLYVIEKRTVDEDSDA